MMAANYRHIGGGENRLGRHYSRFSGIWLTSFFADQSLTLRKSQNAGSNRPSRASTIARDFKGLNQPSPFALRPRSAILPVKFSRLLTLFGQGCGLHPPGAASAAPVAGLAGPA